MNIRPGTKKYKIAVVGLGYVGLPLALELRKFFDTVGYDKNSYRIEQLINNYDKTLEVSKEELKKSDLYYTSNHLDIKKCNIYIVTVPTPIDKCNVPDMEPLRSSSETIGKMLNKDDIVIYESTVYPGATEEFCVPILEKKSKLKFNTDFFCGYSPERINPGDPNNKLTNIKKIISGSNKETLQTLDNIYSTIIKAGIHQASNINVAEAAKVIENIQRDVNIALINELSMLFHKLDIDTLEVLEAAGTKWNFLPFRPGLVGGHCIGVDPYYLTHKANEIGFNPQIILSGRRVNDNMGKYIADSTISEMLKMKKNPLEAKILIMGLTFKEDCPDLRNSKAWDIVGALNKYNCKVSLTDPYLNEKDLKEISSNNFVHLKDAKSFDAVIISVSHEEFRTLDKNSWLEIVNVGGLVVDVKSIYDKTFFKNLNINYWRL
tara:strand:+ start:6160 stop:7461 length:1302 start_codon:yes stop_codon:yes gene_type:complete